MVNLNYENLFTELGLPDDSIKAEKICSHLNMQEKTVLGLDIYKYSKMEEEKQKIVPIVFDILYQQTISWIKEYEKPVFNNINTIRNDFIHTGDGGFQIFDNPIAGIIFLLNFHTILSLYNNENVFQELSTFTGPIEIRSCMTLGKLYKYNKNYFGKPIIQNARILSADKLNRFLIDENVNRWFSKKLHGVLSLKIRTARDIEKILVLEEKSYEKSKIFPQSNYLEVDGFPVGGPIQSITNQKIGDITVKNDINMIYNVEIQRIANIDNNEFLKTIIVNIGNSNANGLSI